MCARVSTSPRVIPDPRRSGTARIPFESAWYDGNKIKLSRDRADRLGYFKEVTVTTPEVAGTTDQVNVNLAVTEKPTGNFLIGAGFHKVKSWRWRRKFNRPISGSGTTVGLGIDTSKTAPYRGAITYAMYFVQLRIAPQNPKTPNNDLVNLSEKLLMQSLIESVQREL